MIRAGIIQIPIILIPKAVHDVYSANVLLPIYKQKTHIVAKHKAIKYDIPIIVLIFCSILFSFLLLLFSISFTTLFLLIFLSIYSIVYSLIFRILILKKIIYKKEPHINDIVH